MIARLVTSATHHSFIPSMDSSIIIIIRFCTNVQGIFEFTNNIHERVHVGRALLDSLLLAIKAIFGEVSIAIGELGHIAIKGGLNPMISIFIHSVVVVDCN